MLGISVQSNQKSVSLEKLVPALEEAAIDSHRVPAPDFPEWEPAGQLSCRVAKSESARVLGGTKGYRHCTSDGSRSLTAAAARPVKSRPGQRGMLATILLKKRDCQPYRNIGAGYGQIPSLEHATWAIRLATRNR